MATFDTKVDECTADPKGIMGVAMLGINRSGEAIYQKTSGRTSLHPEAKPITQDSVFRLASCSKLITSIAALRLVQQDKLSLDDPSLIREHLPELWKQDVFTSLPGQPFTFSKRENEITLRQLLSHSSGVGYDILDPRLQAWRKERGEQPLSLSGPVVDAFGIPLLFQPGDGWSYGGSLDWTGLLIERVTQTKFSTFLRKEVFDIVGCDSGIGFIDDVDPDTCVMTVTRGAEGLTAWPVRPQKAQLGGGGMFASVSNFAKILTDLIAPSPKLLSTKTLSMLFEPQLTDPSPGLSMLRASVPVFASMTGALTGGLRPEAFNHGLGGLLVLEDSEVGRTGGTLTWGGAFNLLWVANRERGVAGFFACSMFPPADPMCSGLMEGFVREVWGRVEG